MKKIITLSSLFFLLLLSAPTFAQDLPPVFDDSVNDETPPAPITGLLPLGLAVGAYLGFKKLK